MPLLSDGISQFPCVVVEINFVAMSSRVAYHFAAAVILTHNKIFPVKAQCTAQGCENGGSSISLLLINYVRPRDPAG